MAPGLQVQRILFEVALDRLAGDGRVSDVVEITLTAGREVAISLKLSKPSAFLRVARRFLYVVSAPLSGVEA